MPVSTKNTDFGLETPIEEETHEERQVPFLYEFKHEKIGSLSPEQQDSVLKIHEDFLEFYRSNPSAYYDEKIWTNEMGNLRERIINAIGIDSFEALMR